MPLPEIKEFTGKLKSKVNFPLSKRSKKTNYKGISPFEEAPIAFETTFGGRQIFLSNIYEYQKYPVIFAYVEHNKRLEPRLFYFSKSHAIWRVAPAVDKKFGKGYEDVSCDLSPELNMALMQHFEKALNNSDGWKPISHDFVDAFTYPFPEQYQEFPKEFEQECSSSKKKIITPNEPGQLTFGYMKEHADYDLAKSIPNPKDLPNLEDTTNIDKLTVNNPFYAKHLIDGPLNIYSCLSYNKKYRYLFAEGKNKNTGEAQRFLLTLAPEPASLSSFGVPKILAKLGYNSITPLMRSANINLFVRKPDNTFWTDIGELYADTSTYTSKLPINYLLNHPKEIEALQLGGKGEVLELANEIEEQEKKEDSFETIEEQKLDENVTKSILGKIDTYINSRTGFLNAITNNFRNDALTQLKLEIARSLRSAMDNPQGITANDAHSYCKGAEALNLIIEEMSEDNKEIFKKFAMLENHRLVTLFTAFITHWDAVRKQAKEENKVTLDTLELPDIYKPFVNDILNKLHEFGNRDEKEGFGKHYRPGFSSKLDKVISEIKSLCPSQELNL